MTTQFQKLIEALEPEFLTIGSAGRTVQILQLALKELALFKGEANGYFGTTTSAALRQLQAEFDLPKTGEFDTSTWYALSFWIHPITAQDLEHVSARSFLPRLPNLLRSIVRVSS